MSDTVKAAALDWSMAHIQTCCCGGVGFVRGNFPVGHPLFGKAIPCVCKRDEQARREAEQLRRQSGLDTETLLSCRFEAFEPRLSRPLPGQAALMTLQSVTHVKRMCEDYAERPRGWLVIVGAYGSGKTHLCKAIVGRRLDRGYSAVMLSTPELLDMLRRAYATDAVVPFEQVMTRLQKVEMLALDDLGAEKASDWTVEKLFQTVNYRYENGLPLVVTTNLPITEATIEPRIRSRLMDGSKSGGMVKVLTLSCGDYRPWRREG